MGLRRFARRAPVEVERTARGHNRRMRDTSQLRQKVIMIMEILAVWARRREVNLDDATMSMGELEVCAPESGKKTPRSKAVLFLKLVLRQALDDGAIAVNLFHDLEDDCLRGLEYFVEQREGQECAWREFYPAPGNLAEQVLDEVRWRSGSRAPSREGTLHYRYLNSRRRAAVLAPSGREVQLYFGDDRPPMRTKNAMKDV